MRSTPRPSREREVDLSLHPGHFRVGAVWRRGYRCGARGGEGGEGGRGGEGAPPQGTFPSEGRRKATGEGTLTRGRAHLARVVGPESVLLYFL